MKLISSFVLVLVCFSSVVPIIYSKEIIAVVDVNKKSLSDPLTLTDSPYTNIKQLQTTIQIDTIQFTKNRGLLLGSKIFYDLTYFDFNVDKFNVNSHEINIGSIKSNNVLLYLYSSPKTLIIGLNEIKYFDVDNAGRDDLIIRYDGLDSETKLGSLSVMRAENDFFIMPKANEFCSRAEIRDPLECVIVNLEKKTFVYSTKKTDNILEISELKKIKAEEIKTQSEDSLSGQIVTTNSPEYEQDLKNDKSGFNNINFYAIKIVIFIGLIIGALYYYITRVRNKKKPSNRKSIDSILEDKS